MEKDFQKKKQLKEEPPRINDVYIPNWARTLIELYKSPLKYEVMDEMRATGELEKISSDKEDE